MKTFFLEILSPQRVFYKGEAVSLIIPISDGMLGIMADHTPLTAAILDGTLTFKKPDGEEVVCAVMRGMADVSDNRVRVLCESVLLPEEIDENAERMEADLAQMEMKKKQSEIDYKLWQLSFNRAVSRLKVTKKKKK